MPRWARGSTRGAGRQVSDWHEPHTIPRNDVAKIGRPYLVSLLESNAIPYRKVGTRRRVLFEHLMAYKKAEDAKRLEVLNELTREAQELGFGY